MHDARVDADVGGGPRAYGVLLREAQPRRVRDAQHQAEHGERVVAGDHDALVVMAAVVPVSAAETPRV